MKKKTISSILSLLLLLSLFGCSSSMERSAASNVTLDGAVQNTAISEIDTESNVPTDSLPKAVVPNTENYTINEAIVCEQYDYNKVGELFIGMNLTGTGDYTDNGLEFLGAQLLRTYEDYNTIFQKALAEEVYMLQKVQSAHQAEQLSAENFEQYDYLMVDFMSYGAMSLYPRLENLLVQDGNVSVDLLFDGFFTSTADNCGVLYFIPIPKGCTEAEVTPISTSFAG